MQGLLLGQWVTGEGAQSAKAKKSYTGSWRVYFGITFLELPISLLIKTRPPGRGTFGLCIIELIRNFPTQPFYCLKMLIHQNWNGLPEWVGFSWSPNLKIFCGGRTVSNLSKKSHLHMFWSETLCFPVWNAPSFQNGSLFTLKIFQK